MPELPDVEIFRRYLEQQAGGADVLEAEVFDHRCLDGISVDRFEEAVAGTELGPTVRRGKYLFVRLAADRWLSLHFGMTGYLQVTEGHQTVDYTRIAFRLAGGRTLHYVLTRMLGRAGIAPSPERIAADKDLGPDALEIDRGEFASLLSSVRGGVKSFLTNQSRIAGIGNIYSDEILFQAGIHPASSCRALDDEARERVAELRTQVLERAVECEVDPERMPADWLLPRREEGARCPRCDGTLHREVIAGRGAYLCPDHQKRYR